MRYSNSNFRTAFHESKKRPLRQRRQAAQTGTRLNDHMNLLLLESPRCNSLAQLKEEAEAERMMTEQDEVVTEKKVAQSTINPHRLHRLEMKSNDYVWYAAYDDDL